MEDLYQLLKNTGHDNDGLVELLPLDQNRTNASVRERDYRKYYNEDTAALVEKYDELIIKKHHYTFD
jgi:hypothetical protein